MTKNLKTNSETASTVKQVQCLKDSLTKLHGRADEEDFDAQRCLDVLAALDSLPVTLEVLSETLIGTIVSKFKSVPSEGDKVSASAKSLIKKWKSLAKTQLQRPVVEQAPQRIKMPDDDKNPPTSSNSSNSNNNTASVEPKPPRKGWGDLPPYRKNVCEKLSEVIVMTSSSSTSNSTSPNHVWEVVSAVEVAMHEYSRGDRQRYGEKARQLNFNLKKNDPLRRLVLSGGVTPSQLCTMSSQELCSSDLAKQRQEDVNKLQESRRLDWEQANEDKINEMCGIKGDLLNASLFTCHRCKSTKTTSTQKQTRSADEPMTVFVLCTNCGNRWKC
jgi:transcription elongation factor S-II